MSENYNGNNQSRDLILSPNEYCYLQTRSSGVIKTYAGPATITVSGQEALVYFDPKTKKFIEINDFNAAKQLFVSPPENWYAVLKNPTKDRSYPEIGKASNSPDIEVGKKINITGPCSFALYPGQMVKLVRGHALRSNQYLLARVYEAESANNSKGEIRDAQGNLIESTEKYVNGQMLVIKGTEVSFYIPPTGIEVIPINNDPANGYTREAVTLERLEYCILKNEQGAKTYVHGPAVVFPKPDESFVASPKGGNIFRAIELSKISGIYVKVIAEYKDEYEVVHPIGEEMFITGADQMIYYPRPEHAIINYDEKILHHAIAIPEGEGRYIMDRMTGEIRTVRGPAMYLPDPRTEVVVKRKLTLNQCVLWFPGNSDALEYNQALTEKSVEKSMRATSKAVPASFNFIDGTIATTANSISSATDSLGFTTANLDATLASLETNGSISRGTSYTKPRTITLDNKFDGVVSIDVWTGYAVNLVSKSGTRKTICGPQTILLDYDQTLEEIQFSTGTPKTTDRLMKTVYLRHENNKISDIINIETKDFVRCEIKVSHCVSFDKEYMDKWFNVENYVKYLCDKVRADVKREAKKYSIEDFYQNYSEIVRNIALGETGNRFFEENGMRLYDCEVLSIKVDTEIENMLVAHQQEMITQSLKLADAEKRVLVAEQLAEAEKKEQELRSQKLVYALELQQQEATEKVKGQIEVDKLLQEQKLGAKLAEQNIQNIATEIANEENKRIANKHAEEIRYQQDLAAIEKERQQIYAETVAKIMASIGPDLVAAMNSKANAQMTETIAKSLAPYALAGENESVSDVVTKLLRGTSLEDVVSSVNIDVNKD